VVWRMLALGVAVGRVILVDEATGEVRWAVQAHPAGGTWRSRVVMSPDGKFVASVGFDDERWKIWDAASGALRRAGPTHDGTGECVCGVPELGQRLVLEGCPVAAHTRGIRAVACSGSRLATGGLDGAIILWDAETGEAERRLLERSTEISSVTFTADGARLASGSVNALYGSGSRVRIWDVTTGTLLRTIQETRDSVLGVHFSPQNSRRLAVAGSGELIHVWDVDMSTSVPPPRSGAIMSTMNGSRFAVFSPDGRTIATVGYPFSRDANLFDVETGTLRFSMVGHTSPLSSASFSIDDGSKLATGSHDGTCKVWDSSTGELLRTIILGTSVGSVAWGRDWVRDTQRGEAFAMGHHPRLGVGSRLLELEVGVVRMILDRV